MIAEIELKTHLRRALGEAFAAVVDEFAFFVDEFGIDTSDDLDGEACAEFVAHLRARGLSSEADLIEPAEASSKFISLASSAFARYTDLSIRASVIEAIGDGMEHLAAEFDEVDDNINTELLRAKRYASNDLGHRASTASTGEYVEIQAFFKRADARLSAFRRAHADIRALLKESEAALDALSNGETDGAADFGAVGSGGKADE